VMTNLPMPGEAQSPANYMKQANPNPNPNLNPNPNPNPNPNYMKQARLVQPPPHAQAPAPAAPHPHTQVDTLVDSLPLCMLIMGQKNSDVVTMYS